MADNAEAWTLLSLALLIILVRVGVRWKLVGPANFQLDDYLMPLAGVGCFDGLFYASLKEVTINIMFFHRSSLSSKQ